MSDDYDWLRRTGYFAKPRQTEAALHRSIARYLDIVLAEPAFCTTFPAGGGGKARGGKLKAMGLVPGVPDILIVANGRAYWVEIKTATGRLSDDQKATIARLESNGARVCVCRSIDDVRQALADWGIPTKEVS